ncbi:helix-turn-helix domain-containing protein [Alkalicoccobacillus plakortidis]|uniref:Helix-turn-helix domain-containing protein n=1 Tax=Alkalicoccobacillus plakortidis TaxID=444060 RepID=A0ABT0XFW2_9BACI|nr:helix-turn-helix domain-containing protein [Alkalicoccobacillus plakortidis]MCM2674114.1 helix-turn-helix domain-containing protein [Alkalicoccobacillus plakortidis]
MKRTFSNRSELELFIQNELLTTNEAMQILGVSRARMNSMQKEGKLTPVKNVGKTVLYLLSDIEERKKEQDILRKKYRPYDE